MAGKEPDIGATAKTVAKNVERLRVANNMNYTQLSEKLLAAANWSINAVGIRRIESEERRVTPDDLIALALAFGVSPATLMMPAGDDPNEEVSLTGVDTKVSASRLWLWLVGQQPLTSGRAMSFIEDSQPPWLWPQWSRDSDG
jgi:transcriptional regulator with XRE-family HTH domain